MTNNPLQKPDEHVPESRKNLLAPDPSDVVAFRQYTKRIWSKVAGRPISDNEADQIIQDFGRFLCALAGKNGE
jgi:hypothetical protein